MVRLDGLGGIEYVERFGRRTFCAFSGAPGTARTVGIRNGVFEFVGYYMAIFSRPQPIARLSSSNV